MAKLSTNSSLRVIKVFCWCSLRNSILIVKQLLCRTNTGQNVISPYSDLLHGMMLFQWFLLNSVWYTFLVLKVYTLMRFLEFSFPQFSIYLLMSSRITVAQKVKNLDLFFKWAAFLYISHFVYTTWLWLNILHMTFS